MNKALEFLLVESGYDPRPSQTVLVSMHDIMLYIRGSLLDRCSRRRGLILLDGPAEATLEKDGVLKELKGKLGLSIEGRGRRRILVYSPQEVQNLKAEANQPETQRIDLKLENDATGLEPQEVYRDAHTLDAWFRPRSRHSRGFLHVRLTNTNTERLYLPPLSLQESTQLFWNKIGGAVGLPGESTPEGYWDGEDPLTGIRVHAEPGCEAYAHVVTLTFPKGKFVLELEAMTRGLILVPLKRETLPPGTESVPVLDTVSGECRAVDSFGQAYGIKNFVTGIQIGNADQIIALLNNVLGRYTP